MPATDHASAKDMLFPGPTVASVELTHLLPHDAWRNIVSVQQHVQRCYPGPPARPAHSRARGKARAPEGLLLLLLLCVHLCVCPQCRQCTTPAQGCGACEAGRACCVRAKLCACTLHRVRARPLPLPAPLTLISAWKSNSKVTRWSVIL